MPISVLHYSVIKDRYCICYLGNCNEYAVQLIYLRPHIERQLPGIQIYLCFKQELSYLTTGYDRILFNKEIEEKKKEFAHIRILKCNMIDHPVMKLFTESNLILPKFHFSSTTRKCIIYPKGCIPTHSLSPDVVNSIKSYCSDQGYTVQTEGNMDGAGWVVGVENEQIYLAGFKGVKTSLVPTGIGTEFYKQLFGDNILRL